MPTFKNRPSPETATIVDDATKDEAPADGRLPKNFRSMDYASQVSALSPLKGAAPKDDKPEASTTAASYRRFKGVYKRFMRGIADRADAENEKHLQTLCDLAADMASAAGKWDEWTDGQIARAARDCDKARKAFFAFRRDAQRAGVDRSLIRQALVANRQLVDARDELRRVQQ